MSFSLLTIYSFGYFLESDGEEERWKAVINITQRNFEREKEKKKGKMGGKEYKSGERWTGRNKKKVKNKNIYLRERDRQRQRGERKRREEVNV